MGQTNPRTICIHNINSHSEIVNSWFSLPDHQVNSGLVFWHKICYDHATEEQRAVIQFNTNKPLILKGPRFRSWYLQYLSLLNNKAAIKCLFSKVFQLQKHDLFFVMTTALLLFLEIQDLVKNKRFYE